MALPIRTIIDDIMALCGYLATKPTGATTREARSILESKYLDARKINALKAWGLIEEEGGRLKISEQGRQVVRDGGSASAQVLSEVIKISPPYSAIVERAAHRQENSITAVEVATHWHEHFKEDASSNDKILNDQAVCFFHVAEGAGLGTLIPGRKGAPTRFEFIDGAVSAFAAIESSTVALPESEAPGIQNGVDDSSNTRSEPHDDSSSSITETDETQLGNSILLCHGKNHVPLEQLEKILDQFNVPFKVAEEEPNLGRPIGQKLKEVMGQCNCAVLIFTADEEFRDKDDNIVWRPSENVIHELGATSFLYENRVVILKEDIVNLPSNFRDIGYISFDRNQLDSKAMDILAELIGFGILKVST